MSLLARVLLAAVLVLPALAQAQPYPSKPIRIIVPFAVGGIADTFARVIGQKVSDAWGQPVVVENKPGAGGNIGADLVAKSPPDGYTLLMGSIGTQAVNMHLVKGMPYDSLKDFAPIAHVLDAEGLLVVNPEVAAKTVPELIALLKARPGKLSYASAGVGTASHLAGELFKTMAKVDITHVPYKGNVPAITDLMSGQTSMLFATLPTVLPQVQAKRLKGIAVLGAKRSSALPDVPTLAESGLRGFEVNNWTGVLAPAGTPAAVVARLNGEIVRIMQLPEVQTRLPKEGLRFVATTPQQFAEFVRSEKEKWAPIVKATGAKAD